MRLFGLFFLAMAIWANGATISSYVNDDGVKVITNVETETRSDEPFANLTDSTNFVPLINQMASLHGVDEALVQAIIKVESDFNPLAVSPKNCKGLMQLHPDTARRFGVQNVFDPAQNIEGGVRYLSYLIDTFGLEIDRILAAYNAGENAVRKYDGIPPYPETVGYVKKVKALFGDKLIEEPSFGKILRLELPDGQVLFTNEPTHLSHFEPAAE
jgi:soluble lytic murein transglycosylase-like protein